MEKTDILESRSATRAATSSTHPTLLTLLSTYKIQAQKQEQQGEQVSTREAKAKAKQEPSYSELIYESYNQN